MTCFEEKNPREKLPLNALLQRKYRMPSWQYLLGPLVQPLGLRPCHVVNFYVFGACRRFFLLHHSTCPLFFL